MQFGMGESELDFGLDPCVDQRMSCCKPKKTHCWRLKLFQSSSVEAGRQGIRGRNRPLA